MSVEGVRLGFRRSGATDKERESSAAWKRAWNVLGHFRHGLLPRRVVRPKTHKVRFCCSSDDGDGRRRRWWGGRCKATWERNIEFPRREAGPPNHHDDQVDSDQ